MNISISRTSICATLSLGFGLIAVNPAHAMGGKPLPPDYIPPSIPQAEKERICTRKAAAQAAVNHAHHDYRGSIRVERVYPLAYVTVGGNGRDDSGNGDEGGSNGGGDSGSSVAMMEGHGHGHGTSNGPSSGRGTGTGTDSGDGNQGGPVAQGSIDPYEVRYGVDLNIGDSLTVAYTVDMQIMGANSCSVTSVWRDE